MLIAIPTEANMVCPHFGHCEVFTLYDSTSKELRSIPNPGHQPGFLPGFLRAQGVDLVIAGGMGGRAQDLFAEQGIALIVGVAGKIEDVISQYEKKELKSTGEVCHEHSHAEDCHS